MIRVERVSFSDHLTLYEYNFVLIFQHTTTPRLQSREVYAKIFGNTFELQIVFARSL